MVYFIDISTQTGHFGVELAEEVADNEQESMHTIYSHNYPELLEKQATTSLYQLRRTYLKNASPPKYQILHAHQL